MGMYTELVIKAMVKDKTPKIVTDVLEYLFNSGESVPSRLPEHKFFTLMRWPMIGRCGSYYHVPWSSSRIKDGYIFSRSDLKNYDGEISEFLDWIIPHLDTWAGQCIGWKWNEEDDAPTLIIVPGAEPEIKEAE